MHVDEGRPFFVIVTGKIYIEEEDDHIHKGTGITIDNVFEKLTKGITACNAKLVSEDDTGGLYEISKGLVSVASRSYLLVGHGKYSIPVILVIQDLLYPSRKPENVTNEIQHGVKFLENLVKRTLPKNYVPRIRIAIVDARVVDAPFSLDQIEFVPER